MPRLVCMFHERLEADGIFICFNVFKLLQHFQRGQRLTYEEDEDVVGRVHEMLWVWLEFGSEKRQVLRRQAAIVLETIFLDALIGEACVRGKCLIVDHTTAI